MSSLMKNWPIKSDHHLEAALGMSIKEIDAIITDLDVKMEETAFYYSFIKKQVKRNGKIKSRLISPSKMKLSLVQDRIKDRILIQIPLPEYIHGGRKKHDGLTNAKEHQGKNNHFCTDLKDFFPYVSNKKVYNVFDSLGFIPDIARRLTRLVTYNGHLPQGASTSTAMANLVFYFEIGKPLEKLLKDKNITMTSFVDDLSLSSEQKFDGIENLVLAQILKAGFLYNHQKTVLKMGKIDMTGANVRQNRLQAPLSIKDKLNEPHRTDQSKKGVLNYIKRVEIA